MNDHNSEKHLILVDGSGFIFRAYHALPPLRKSDGTPTGAVSGYCNMLFKLINELKEFKATHIAVVFDHKDKTFRSNIYPDYKANRPPPPEDLVPQFQLIRDATEAFGFLAIDKKGYEADDIIATLAKNATEEGAIVTIFSSDKDLMQLVSDDTKMYDPIRNIFIDIEKLRENDIHVNISYPFPIHLMEGYSSLDYKKGDLPITEKISQEIFSLPMYPTLSEDEQRKVINVLKTIDSNYL